MTKRFSLREYSRRNERLSRLGPAQGRHRRGQHDFFHTGPPGRAQHVHPAVDGRDEDVTRRVGGNHAEARRHLKKAVHAPGGIKQRRLPPLRDGLHEQAGDLLRECGRVVDIVAEENGAQYTVRDDHPHQAGGRHPGVDIRWQPNPLQDRRQDRTRVIGTTSYPLKRTPGDGIGSDDQSEQVTLALRELQDTRYEGRDGGLECLRTGQLT